MRHLYLEDLAVPADRHGRRSCRCGLPETNEVHLHELPERSGDDRELEDRRFGERDD